MNSLSELDEKKEIDQIKKDQLLNAIKDFSYWLKELNVTKESFSIENIVIEPFSNEDWIMRVKEQANNKIASFNPFILNHCSYEFFEVVILHEFFHLVVQGVPNKEDATKIKDDFGSDFMSLIDIEADFYVALYLKRKRLFDLKKYWTLYFEGSKVFIDKSIRNKKFERFLGSVLTINKLYQTDDDSFDLYLPSISPVFTQEKMSVLVVKEKHIGFEELNTKYEDFRDIKKLYLQPDHLSIDGYFSTIENFTKKAFLK